MSSTSSRTRARSWYANCGVAGPTRASTSAMVGSGIATSVIGRFDRVRRVSAVDGMLLGTVLLWAFNVTVTKFMFEHGWQPLAYGTIRYFLAILLFLGFTWWRERSFRIDRGDWWLVALAGGCIFVN